SFPQPSNACSYSTTLSSQRLPRGAVKPGSTDSSGRDVGPKVGSCRSWTETMRCSNPTTSQQEGIKQVTSSHTLDRTHVAFDDECVLADAGCSCRPPWPSTWACPSSSSSTLVRVGPTWRPRQ